MTNIYDDAEASAELILRIVNHLTQPDEWGKTVMQRLRDAKVGHPKAQSFATDRVSASGISDPTGNAATGPPDIAAQHERQLQRLMHQIHRAADQATLLLAIYSPRHPTEHERSEMAREADPHCESCSRISVSSNHNVAWWVEPHSNGSGNAYRTTMNDALKDAMWLCKFCMGHVSSRSCLPNTDELEQHRDGKRIRCPHPVKEPVVGNA